MARKIVHHTHTTLQLVGLHSASADVEWVPNTDIYENESFFIVRMEVAGATREDIQVTISDRTLIVRGRRQDQGRTQRCYFRQMEIHYGIFERRLVLPRNVDGKRVKANYRNGFLILELPKVAKSDPVPLKIMVEEE